MGQQFDNDMLMRATIYERTLTLFWRYNLKVRAQQLIFPLVTTIASTVQACTQPGFLEGGYMGVYACISMLDQGGLGAGSPRKFLENRCSEIASKATSGQKQSRSSYTWFVQYCIQLLALLVCICQQAHFTGISKREGTKVGRTVGGVTSLRRELW